jgi:hypothetical protein
VEFTGVELASGAELVTPVEKATAGPVEKVVAGLCAGEARGGGRTVEREEDRLLCSSAEEMPVERRHDGGERSAVESIVAEVAQQSVGIAVR